MAARVDKVSGLTFLPEKRSDDKIRKNWKATNKGIVFEKKACHLTKKSKMAAILLGFALSGCLIGGLYFAGIFSKAPTLADALEGEADFQTDDGGKEVYNIKMDFTKKLIQLTYVTETHNSNNRERRDATEAKPSLNFKKIVIQDYKNKKMYAIVPGKNGTTKCLRMALKGEMIPKDLLKHAKSEEIPNSMKQRIAQRLRFADQSEADVLVPPANETQDLIYRGNGWNISVHSKKEKYMNFTDVSQYKCFEYEEETNKIEDDFYSSDQAKYLLENLSEIQQEKLDSISKSLNISNINQTDLEHNRLRRSIVDKLSRWSHGNWCGAYTGGYENHCKFVRKVCTEPYDVVSAACKECNPIEDDVDEHCMEHDRCLLEHGPGPNGCFPQGNRCSCDYRLIQGAIVGGTKCAFNGNFECVKAAASITLLFTTALSCWFPTSICFPRVQVECDCSACSCPSLKTHKVCVPVKLCVPFGSGKISW